MSELTHASASLGWLRKPAQWITCPVCKEGYNKLEPSGVCWECEQKKLTKDSVIQKAETKEEQLKKYIESNELLKLIEESPYLEAR